MLRDNIGSDVLEIVNPDDSEKPNVAHGQSQENLIRLLKAAISIKDLPTVKLLCKSMTSATRNSRELIALFQDTCLQSNDGEIDILMTLLQYMSFYVLWLPILDRNNMNALETSLVDKKYQNVMFFLLQGANPFETVTTSQDIFELAVQLDQKNENAIDKNFLTLLSHVQVLEKVIVPVLKELFCITSQPNLIVQFLEYILMKLSDKSWFLDMRKMSDSLTTLIHRHPNFQKNLIELISFINSNKKISIGDTEQYASFFKFLSPQTIRRYQDYIYEKIQRMINTIYINNARFFLASYSWKVEVTEQQIRYFAIGDFIVHDGIKNACVQWLPIVDLTIFKRQKLIRTYTGIYYDKRKELNQQFLKRKATPIKDEIWHLELCEENLIYLCELMLEQDKALSLMMQLNSAILLQNEIIIFEICNRIEMMFTNLSFNRDQQTLFLSCLHQTRDVLFENKSSDFSVLIKKINYLIEKMSVPALKDLTLNTILKNNIPFWHIPKDLEKQIKHSHYFQPQTWRSKI